MFKVTNITDKNHFCGYSEYSVLGEFGDPKRYGSDVIPKVKSNDAIDQLTV